MPPINRNLIEKYIHGRCTPEEEELIHSWIDKNDADEYPSFLAESKYWHKEQKNWKRLASSLEGLKPLPARRKPVLSFLLRYAAVLAILVSSAWLLNNYTNG